MNSSLSKLTIFTFFLVFVTLYFSCTKIITTDIGSGLIPPVDDITTKDTVLDVTTKNTGYDTAFIGISDNHVLGYVNDPIFGKTNASVNFQVAPAFIPFSLGIPKDSILLDSVVLCLSYHGAWGDTLPHLKLHVYSMDPEVVFDNNATYNSVTTFEKGQDITEFPTGKDVDITRLNDVDTTDHYSEPTTYQLRIKLNNTFGQQLIDYDSATVYQSDSTFYNSLRGLIVEPADATGNALMIVNLVDTSTHLSLYYHSKDLKDTLTRRFTPNPLTSASSNTIIRNYVGTQIPSYVNSPDTSDDMVFMQTNPGTHTIIDMHSIMGMPNVIVHRAEMLMYQVPDASDTYFTPPNLFLAAYSKDSGRAFAVPNDVQFFGNSVSNLTQFGVLPKKQAGSDAYYYSFDLSRYVQGIVTRKDTIYNLLLSAPYNQSIYTQLNPPTFLVPISSPALNTVGIGRIRLGGGSNTQYKMRLHIVYSLVQ